MMPYNAHFMDPRFYGIKIACLPRDFETPENAKILVEEYLRLGIVKNIQIKNKKIDERNVCSAYIEFLQYNYTNYVIHHVNALTEKDAYEYTPPNPIFIWPDNNAYMSYISMQKFVLNNDDILKLSENEWTSLHIPVLTEFFVDNGNGQFYVFKAREYLQDLIEYKLCIGKVKRIDFVERDDIYMNENGAIVRMEENNKQEPNILAAFIHMEFWYNNTKTQQIRYNLNTHGQYHVKSFNFYGVEHLFYGKNKTNKHYFVLKINHKPIPDADGKLNIHQLTAINLKLKEELEQMQEELKRIKGGEQLNGEEEEKPKMD